MARSFIAAAALLALAGCNTTGPGTGDVKLGVDVAAIQGAVANAVTGGSNDGSLAITRVRVLVAHAKVGYIHEQATGPAAEIGPIVVELTADEIASGAHRDFDLGKLPTGTYGGAEIEIEPLDATADTSDPALADFVSSKASVLVEGTYQGNAFSFAGHFLAEQGTDGDVTVDAATPVSLALTVDPSKWFLDANGAAVDPSDATQHDTLAVAMCKTLDTQPQTGPAGGGSQPQHKGGGGPTGGGPGGGNGAHCVEASN
jgi:hypothetical protein